MLVQNGESSLEKLNLQACVMGTEEGKEEGTEEGTEVGTEVIQGSTALKTSFFHI